VHPSLDGLSEYGVVRFDPDTCTGTVFTRVLHGLDDTSFGGLPTGSPFTWMAR
jgi:hypothetical protein